MDVSDILHFIILIYVLLKFIKYLYYRNLNDNPVSCVQTTAEIFLNFTWNDWMSIHNDIRIPQSCIHTPVHSHNYWYNINDIRILYFTGCNGKIINYMNYLCSYLLISKRCKLVFNYMYHV